MSKPSEAYDRMNAMLSGNDEAKKQKFFDRLGYDSYEDKMERLRLEGQAEQKARLEEMAPSGSVAYYDVAPRTGSIAGDKVLAEESNELARAAAPRTGSVAGDNFLRAAGRESAGGPPRQIRVIDDQGGYQYGEMSDGSFKILQSPWGSQGIVVRPGMRGFDAIKKHAESVQAVKALLSAGAGVGSSSASAMPARIVPVVDSATE